MISLFFACLVAGIFAGVVMLEAEGAEARRRYWSQGFGQGLIRWLASGNWPAKLGGGLLVIGIGALLRYSLLRVEVDPIFKLSGGIVLSAALFACAQFVRTRFGRREVAVALAGAAFGVAYLTAYSAYAFFHYLQSSTGLVVLALVAIAAGSYAVFRNAISVALLAMLGAYMAPAFALEQPSAVEVFGYYIAISQLALVMIAIRGWRPLMHLSFLFTLAGGVFFAWSSAFYTAAHFATMQPLVLILVAIHLAMPLVEQRSPLSRWRIRFDSLYFAALPIVAAVLMIGIAPSASALAGSFLILGGIWIAAALASRVFNLQAGLRHAVVGSLFLALAAYVHMPSLPWLLIGEAISVAAFLGATRFDRLRSLRDIAAGGTLAFGVAHIAASLASTAGGLPFINEVVLERIACGALLVIGWQAARKSQHPLAQLTGWAGAFVLANTTIVELYRCDIASWPTIVHIALLLCALGTTAVASRRPISAFTCVLLALGLMVTSTWAITNAGGVLLAILLVATPIALLSLALRRSGHDANPQNGDRMLALLFVPLSTWIWARPVAESVLHVSTHFVPASAALAAIAATFIVRRRAQNESWPHLVFTLFGVIFGSALLGATAFQIERGTWAIVENALCLAVLLQLNFVPKSDANRGGFFYLISALGSVLAAQAMLLRILGPDRTMTLFDVLDLQWPAVISLFWSALGATLTIVARKSGSRALWSVGASVLVGCAAKLILLDFGSLGELTNILAVIGAGLVFLLVSWLAPLPPKDALPNTAAAKPNSTTQDLEHGVNG